MDIIPRILAIITLWELIAMLFAVVPLLSRMNSFDSTDMTAEDVASNMNFLAEWIKNWLTGMVQIPSLIISIIANFLYVIRYGNSWGGLV